MATNTTVESETLEAFLPDLVTAICDDVQRITDQCLSTGLISESKRRWILELRGSEDQARALIQCVQNSTKTDNRCFDIFLDSLDKELPRLVKEKLLSDMRKDLEDRSRDGVVCKAIPESPAHRSRLMLQSDRQECLQQQSSLFGRYESSVKNYAHASAEKVQYKESLQNKTKERDKFRAELKSLKGQSSEADDVKEIESAKERLSACEIEITELREKVEKLEGVMQEEDMLARRGKSIIMVGTKIFARMTAEHALKEKEEECKRLLKEKEDELQKRIQEEKDREQKVVQAKVKDEWELERQLKKRVTFHEAYGELLPFADEWRSIGILLEVPLDIVKKINVEQTDSLCLADVLEDYAPIRKKLNDVVEKVKAAKAEKIR